MVVKDESNIMFIYTHRNRHRIRVGVLYQGPKY